MVVRVPAELLGRGTASRSPIVPSVAMKAKASGMPAKLAATPENVVSLPRIQRGVPSRTGAYAMRKPSRPPSSAVTRLTSIEFLNALRYGSSTSLRHVVERPAAVRALERADHHVRGGEEAGTRSRRRGTAARRATPTTSASPGRCLPAGGGRRCASCCSAAYEPTFEGHCALISAAPGLLPRAREPHLRVRGRIRQRVDRAPSARPSA